MDYYKLKILNHRKEFVIGLIALIIIGVLIYYFYIRDKDVEVFLDNVDSIEEKENLTKEDNQIFVDIKGYVNKPGVYSFMASDNARINDLINKAGGLKKEADTSIINLSKKLEDEMAVIVYSKKEINDYTKTLEETKKKLELCELNLKNNACLNEETRKTNSKVNLNTASIDELQTLSGIGEEKAKAIIDYRKKKKFGKIDEVKEVSGIGESLFEKIKDSLTV